MCSIFKIPVCPLHECLVYRALLASNSVCNAFSVSLSIFAFFSHKKLSLKPGTLCSAREPHVSYVFWSVEAAVGKAEDKIPSFQHKSHSNSMSTTTEFSFPFFLSPQLSPSLLWKKQMEFTMRLDSHEHVQRQRCSWTACSLLPQPEIGGNAGNLFAYEFWLTLPWG